LVNVSSFFQTNSSLFMDKNKEEHEKIINENYPQFKSNILRKMEVNETFYYNICYIISKVTVVLCSTSQLVNHKLTHFQAPLFFLNFCVKPFNGTYILHIWSLRSYRVCSFVLYFVYYILCTS